MLYSSEKYHAYLEHKEFCLHTNNQALTWLLLQTEELGQIRCWVLCLVLFKFKVCHVSLQTNVADCLIRQYEDFSVEALFAVLVFQHPPESFQSFTEHETKGSYCKDIVMQTNSTVQNFKLLNGTYFTVLLKLR